ncbi:hypothetical protein NQZ68_004714 [Dissostichus eleginoides]|nr:hypothetical protein NQZ68_004714 [Dissostichus eleginoides]
MKQLHPEQLPPLPPVECKTQPGLFQPSSAQRGLCWILAERKGPSLTVTGLDVRSTASQL